MTGRVRSPVRSRWRLRCRIERVPAFDELSELQAVAPEVQAEVLKAYYPRAVAQADAARARALNAFTVASAVATAIVTAGVVTGIQDRPPLVQIAGVFAFTAWLAAAAAFARALAGGVRRTHRGATDDPQVFAAFALDNARHERAVVDWRLSVAQVITVVAMATTVVAVAAGLATTQDLARRDATLVLSPAGQARLAEVCGAGTPTVEGKVVVTTLADEFVDIRLAPGHCGGGETDVRLRRDDVLAVRLRRTRAGVPELRSSLAWSSSQ